MSRLSEDDATDEAILEIEVRAIAASVSAESHQAPCGPSSGCWRDAPHAPMSRTGQMRHRPRSPNSARRSGESRRVASAGARRPYFPKWQGELFKTILDEENLPEEREGRPRTAYCLRHTYICLRLM